MERAKEPKGSFVRWQTITITQLTYSVNLVLGLCIATLGFQISLLLGERFAPTGWRKCAFFASLLLVLSSIVFGILCVMNRLRDFRTTAKAARKREDGRPEQEIEPLRVRYKELGRRTWRLFDWQIGTFCGGIVFVILGVWEVVTSKLL